MLRFRREEKTYMSKAEDGRALFAFEDAAFPLDMDLLNLLRENVENVRAVGQREQRHKFELELHRKRGTRATAKVAGES